MLYTRHSKKWQQITESVAFSLAKDSLPLYTVDKPGFRKMLHTLDPRYELPSRKYFSNVAIPKMYQELKENVAKELVDVEYFSATSDLWSSANMEPCLSFTVHFISNDWKIHNRCLQTLFCPSDHTAENLAEVLKESLHTWNLEQDQLSCILSDNGSNFTKAIRYLGWPHLSCLSHNLHLAVTSATRDDRRVSHVLALCRKLVGTFSHSWKKRRDLSKAQVDLDIPQHSLISIPVNAMHINYYYIYVYVIIIMLISMLRVHFTTSFQDCDTRWGSQQRMIHRILEQENAIRQVLGADRKTTHLLPTWQDTDVLESLDKALSPVAEFTNIMSMEHHVTVSSLRPLLHHLETEVLLQKENDTHLTANIKKHILMSLQRRYDDDDVSELIDKAGFLDPRFRLEYVSEENIPLMKDCIAREATKILEADDTGDIHVPTQTPDIPPPAKKRKLGSILKKKETNEYRTLSTEEKVEKEIDEYLQCPQLDTEANISNTF